MSLANDVFHGLSKGLRFSKARNEVAIGIASREIKAGKRKRTEGEDAAAPMPAELDFFGEHAAAPAAATLSCKPTADLMPLRDADKNAKRGLKKQVEKAVKVKDQVESIDIENVNAFRKQLRIRVRGSDVPAPSPTFSRQALLQDGLSSSERDQQSHVATLLLGNIESSKYTEPTAIQMQSIPAMLAERDVLGVAPTGSGKTAAFLIPLIMRLAANRGASALDAGENKKAEKKKKKKEKKKKKKQKEAKNGEKSNDEENDEQEDHERDQDQQQQQQQKGDSRLRSVIIAPTRELAQQIFREFEKLTVGKHFRACVLKKATLGNVSASLLGKDGSKGFHLVVSTPLRMVKLVQTAGIDLSGVETLVLDEADKLFEMGFLEQLDEIVSACGDGAQRALFSATMPQQIEQLAQSILRDPVEIFVGLQNAGAETIDQKLMFVGQEQGKMVALRQLIQAGELVPPTLIFTQSKERCKELFSELAYEAVRADCIHAERTQAQREQTVQKFRNGEVWVLICTDLMGRGIDFKGVNCVVNYDFPTSAVSYIHRIGRTGRAQRRGKAITLFTIDDIEHLRSIANIVRINGCAVPDWMLKLKKTAANDRKRLEKAPLKRAPIRSQTTYDRDRAAKKRNIVKQSKAAAAKTKQK